MSESTHYNSSKVWKRAITSSLGFFTFGYSIGVFTSSQTCISNILHWGSNSEILIATMSAIIPFGGIVGSISAGFMSKFHGKRYNLMITDTLMILGCLLAYYPNTITFALGRFLCGVAVGCFSMLGSGYTSEFTPKEVSAKMGTLSQFFIMSGICVSNSICLALPTDNCSEDIRFYVFLIFLVPAPFALMQLLILFKVFKRESPFWHLKHKNYELALESMASIYNPAYAELEIEKHVEREKNQNASVTQENFEPSYWQLISCKKGTTKAMRLGTLAHVFQQLSGINAIVFYSTLLFQDFGEGVFFARVLTVAASVLRTGAMLFLFPFIDKVSKKKVMVCGTFLMGCCFFVLMFTQGTGLSVLLVVFIFMFFVVFSNSIGPIAWIYSSLVMPDKGLALAVAMNWTTATMLVLFFPFLITGIGLAYTFLILAVMNVISSVYFALDMVDSTGFSKQELRKVLSEMS